MLNMASTSLLALATMLLTGSVWADDGAARIAAVATTRATIIAGVRIAQPDRRLDAMPLEIGAAPPRERPCPERDRTPCRLIVTDIP